MVTNSYVFNIHTYIVGCHKNIHFHMARHKNNTSHDKSTTCRAQYANT